VSNGPWQQKGTLEGRTIKKGSGLENNSRVTKMGRKRNYKNGTPENGNNNLYANVGQDKGASKWENTRSRQPRRR